MKKKLFLLATITICTALFAMGTLAYTPVDGQAHNVITTGNVQIAIKESRVTTSGALEAYPSTAIPAMPATSASKIAQVENTGKADAYVRAKYDVKVTSSTGAALQWDAKAIDTTGRDQKWVNGNDGWYYYTDIVKAKNLTEPLFTEVVFNGPNMGNEYQGSSVQVNVYAQAVQAANQNADDVSKVKGWPAE